MTNILTILIALVIPSLVACQSATPNGQQPPVFSQKRNLFHENQNLTIQIALDSKFKNVLATLTNVPYTYVRNQKYSVSFNVTLGDLVRNPQYHMRIFTDEYEAWTTKGKSSSVPQGPRQIIAKETASISLHPKDNTKFQFQERIDFNLVFSQNITDPSDEGLQIYTSPEYYFEPATEGTQFWVLESMKRSFNREEILANETLAAKSFEIKFQFQIISLKGFMLTLSMRDAFHITPAMQVAGEQIKELLGENSIEYLLFTFCAHVLHGIFHMLSLKNDIEYWNNVKDFGGVSLSNIWWEAFFHVLQVLYFWDTKFDGPALWLIYMTTLVSLQRIFKVHFRRKSSFPFFEFHVPESYRAQTQRIESKVIKIQLYIFSLVIAGYFGYRYFFNPPQEGLYTFTLKCMMYFSMAFSFVQMTPQVYINYVYKSVPPMPVRMLIYKFLDATVDDLITLALSLPPITLMMHFTDDLIFAVLMFQRWMYKVDERRTENSHRDKPIEVIVAGKDVATPTPAATEEQPVKQGRKGSDSSDDEVVERKGTKAAESKKKKGKGEISEPPTQPETAAKPKTD